MKILIKDAVILTMNEKNELLKNTNVGIENDIIKFVGDVPYDFKADKVIEGSKKVVMPGLVNAHSHMAMTLFRNYADDMPLWEWLTEKIWPVENKLTGEDVYWGTMLGIVESIKSGVTCFSDMYLYMNDTARAVLESGIRARLSWGMFGDDGSDDSSFDMVRKFYSDWNNKGEGRISVMAGPHSPYTCSPEYLKRVRKLAEELNIGVHIHLSESKKETLDNYDRFGKSPIKHVCDLGLFDVPVTAAHCVQLSGEDIDILAEKHVSVINNPGSNLKLGNGFAPVAGLIERGVNVALGTDGASSNNNLNMFEEMNLAALINKGASGDPTCIPAITAIEMATKNGAKALRMESEIGSVEPGKKADLIILDINKPHFYPLNNIISSIVYSAQASDVETVIINGNIVMEGYEIKTIDVKRVYENAERCIRRLLS